MRKRKGSSPVDKGQNDKTKKLGGWKREQTGPSLEKDHSAASNAIWKRGKALLPLIKAKTTKLKSWEDEREQTGPSFGDAYISKHF